MTTASMSSTATIANDLVEKCRKGDFQGAIQAYYSPEILSIEAMSPPGQPLEVKGLEAVLEKGKQWAEMTEVHSMNVSDPLIAGHQFAVQFSMDVTNKMMNQRMEMQEIGVYEVKDGKIVREQFFYDSCPSA